jgi:gliding motility-associated-like protein
MYFFRIIGLTLGLILSGSCWSSAQLVVWNGHLGDIANLADGVTASPTLQYIAPPDFCGPCDAFCNSGQPGFFGYSVADDAFNTSSPTGIQTPPYVEAQLAPLPAFELSVTALELYVWSYENFSGTQWGPRKVDIGWSTNGTNWNVTTHDVNTDNDDCQTLHTPANASYIEIPVNVTLAGPLFLRMQFYEANGTNDIGNFETDIFQISVAGSSCFSGDASSFTPLPPQAATICPGDSLFLSVTDQDWPLQYSWTPSSTTSTPDQPSTWVTPSSTTTYTLQIRDECGFFYEDMVTIPVEDSIPVSIIQAPLSACEGDPVVLTAVTPPGSQLTWSTGAVENMITVTESGNYQLSVTDGNCSLALEQQLAFQPYPQIAVPSEATLCQGYPLTINALMDTADFLWNDGTEGPIIEIMTPGVYTLSATSNGCTTQASVLVQEEICDCQVYIPNVFTPNFDGINDRFQPYIQCDGATISEFEMLIFSRWGELVFQSNAPEQAWEGLVKGQRAPHGVYTYLIRYNLQVNGVSASQQQSGDIILLP